MGLTLRLAAGSRDGAGLRGIVAVSIRRFLACPGGAHSMSPIPAHSVGNGAQRKPYIPHMALNPHLAEFFRGSASQTRTCGKR